MAWSCPAAVARSSARQLSLFPRQISTTSVQRANPLGATATGPPPAAPQPSASEHATLLDRRAKQAELLKRGQQIRDSAKPTKPSQALKRRFWKDVHVKLADNGEYTVNLDTRPIRHPYTKTILTIPASKPHLATSIALEWDLLVTAQQALKTHLIPLTSLVARAIDLEMQDAGSREGKTRAEIITMLLRYLDTDTLLSWASKPSESNDTEALFGMAATKGSADDSTDSKSNTLRDLQISTATPITTFLTTHLFPGAVFTPSLPDDSILPVPQPSQTREIIQGWLNTLPAYELAGLERAVLATKSLCVAMRFIVEWSETFRDLRSKLNAEDSHTRFGVETAAKAASLEVDWQTGMWGEVEDTHDVEKEDMRRQLGSAMLLVSGVAPR